MKKYTLILLCLTFALNAFASKSAYLILRAVVPRVYSVNTISRGPAGNPQIEIASNDLGHSIKPKVVIESSIHPGHQRISIIHP